MSTRFESPSALSIESYECASWPARQVLDIQASNIDGVGAQSVFGVINEGRTHIFASLLAKERGGIADAWRLRDQSKADISDFSSFPEKSSHTLRFLGTLCKCGGNQMM